MRIANLLLLVPALCMAQGRPRLVLDAADFDFGRIAQGERVTHRYKVTNGGDATLKITRLAPTCGCTSTVLGKDALEPGESASLEVAFNPVGYRGRVRKTVDVASNDPDTPRRTLAIEADVMADVMLATDEVFFHDLTPGSLRKASLRLVSGTGSAIAVADADLSDAPWLGVATRNVGKDVSVDFELMAKRLPPQRQDGVDTVVLHLLNPRPTTVTLRVRWEKRGSIVALPERVAWAEPAGQPHLATVLVKSRGGKPFRILTATTTNPALKVGELPAKAAAKHQIQLELGAGVPEGVYAEKVVLTLDAPGKPVLEVKVDAVLK